MNLNSPYLVKPSKEQMIMDTARNLFWKHGISRIMIKEICEESGVSKMTFYRLFDNKTDLAKKVLEREYQKGVASYKSIMNQDIPFPDKITQMLHLKFEESKGMSHELISDIFKNQKVGLIEQMQKHTEEGIQMIMADFLAAQKQGWIRKDVKPEFILYMLKKLVEIETDPALVTLFPNPQDMAIALIQFFFYGILPHK